MKNLESLKITKAILVDLVEEMEETQKHMITILYSKESENIIHLATGYKLKRICRQREILYIKEKQLAKDKLLIRQRILSISEEIWRIKFNKQ